MLRVIRVLFWHFKFIYKNKSLNIESFRRFKCLNKSNFLFPEWNIQLNLPGFVSLYHRIKVTTTSRTESTTIYCFSTHWKFYLQRLEKKTPFFQLQIPVLINWKFHVILRLQDSGISYLTLSLLLLDMKDFVTNL